MKVLKATKKPVTIECVQFDGRNISEIEEFIGKKLKSELFSDSAYQAGIAPPLWTVEIETLEGNHTAMPNDYIIKGVKGEFYPCKPDIFLKTYTIENEGKTELFDFGRALELLKEGKKVCRLGWNGQGMFIMLQPGSTVKGNMMRNEPAKEFYGDSDVVIQPHIDMKAADGSYTVGWTASQVDMLAEDWMEAK